LRGGSQEDIGFIVTRCVKKKEHNTLFQECYQAIRKFHPEVKIIFIDDNSDKSILENYDMNNVEIIQSEYPAAGEYLPYWYFLQRKMFKKAIFLQDSMILNTRIPYEDVTDFMYLYEMTKDIGNLYEITKDTNDGVKLLLDNTKIPTELNQFNEATNWKGCWGSTMVITDEYIQKLEDTIQISKWKDIINSRLLRVALERAIAICCAYISRDKQKFSLFGDISEMHIMKDPGNEKYNLNMYLEDKSRIKDSIIKIWNTR